jgi:GGDEF domain-containing protein
VTSTSAGQAKWLLAATAAALAGAAAGWTVLAVVAPLVAAVLLRRDGGRRVPIGASVFGGLSAVLFTVEVVSGSESLLLDVAYLIAQLVGVSSLAWNCRHLRPRSVLGADIFCVLACSSLLGWLFFGVVLDGDLHVAVFGALSFGNLMTIWMLMMQYNRHTRALRWFGTYTAPTLAIGYFVEAFGTVRADGSWLATSDVVYALCPVFVTAALVSRRPKRPTSPPYEADVRMSAVWMSGALAVGGASAALGLTRSNAEPFVGVTVGVLVVASLWRVAASALLEVRLYRLALIAAQTDPETRAMSRFAIRDELACLAPGRTVAKVRFRNFDMVRRRFGPGRADALLAELAQRISVIPHDSLGRTSETDLVIIADDLHVLSGDALRRAVSTPAASTLGLQVAAITVEVGDTASSIDLRLDDALSA